MRGLVILAAMLNVLALSGCVLGPAPAGPGAASTMDLSPWLKSAPTVTYTGRLQYFNCTSEHGNYLTWSLDPAGEEDAAEVDVRACVADASKLENQRVTITGKLLYREPRHFPLLVAQRITPAQNAELADATTAR